jgi:hypothetical protein
VKTCAKETRSDAETLDSETSPDSVLRLKASLVFGRKCPCDTAGRPGNKRSVSYKCHKLATRESKDRHDPDGGTIDEEMPVCQAVHHTMRKSLSNGVNDGA